MCEEMLENGPSETAAEASEAIDAFQQRCVSRVQSAELSAVRADLVERIERQQADAVWQEEATREAEELAAFEARCASHVRTPLEQARAAWDRTYGYIQRDGL